MTKNQIISNLFTGKSFNDCILKMDPSHLQEDLRQEVILIVCELPEEKIIQMHQNKVLEFYTVRIILNQIKSKTSPFAKKYRSIHQAFPLNYTSQDPGIEERLVKEGIEDTAVEEVGKLFWYNKGLIELYMKHGNFRAIQKATGIPFCSCYKTIKKSLQEIKVKVS